MEKPGHRRDKSAHSYRIESGISIYTILFVIYLVSEHGTKNGMAQMIVGSIPGKVGIKMLDSMIDMFLDRDLLVVAFL